MFVLLIIVAAALAFWASVPVAILFTLLWIAAVQEIGYHRTTDFYDTMMGKTAQGREFSNSFRPPPRP